MKTNLFFLPCLLFFYTHSDAQDFEWVKSIGGISTDNSNSLLRDQEGNLYLSGTYEGMVDFDPGPGMEIRTAFGYRDMFVLKLNNEGNFVWVNTFGGLGYQESTLSSTMDPFGSIILTGHFEDTCYFYPDTATDFIVSSGQMDVFIIKFDANGNIVWSKTVGGISQDNAYNIGVDSGSNLIITGFFTGTADFDPGAGFYNLTSGGFDDAFVLKLDVNGNFIWVKSFAGTATSYGNSVDIDDHNNIYITGWFSGVVDFDPGPDTLMYTSSGNYDVFVNKLDGQGLLLWAKVFGGIDRDMGWGVKVSNQKGVYILGTYKGQSDFDPSSGTFYLDPVSENKFFLESLDSSGNFQWVKAYGCEDYYFYLFPRNATIDSSGNIYIPYSYKDTCDLDPGVDLFILVPFGGYDASLLKLDSAGNFIGAITFGGLLNDFCGDLVLDEEQNIYLLGVFSSTVDFNIDTGVFNLTSNGATDVFLVKVSQPNTSVRELAKGININAIPNPSSGIVFININETLQHVELTISDITGKQILVKSFASLCNTTVELPESSGIYFLKIKSKEGQQVMKLIRE